MKNENRDSLSIARRIRDAGRSIYIAEDDGEPRYLPADSLVVRQTGSVMERRAIESGGTSIIIALAITCNLSKLAISRFHVELPWNPDCFYCLEDPLQIYGSSRPYRVPSDAGLDFERHRVINHHADITQILSPGHSLEGFLLGYAFGSVPEEFRTGMMLPAFVIIYNQFGAMHRTGVQLHLVRRPKRPSRRKRSLLDRRDHIVRD